MRHNGSANTNNQQQVAAARQLLRAGGLQRYTADAGLGRRRRTRVPTVLLGVLVLFLLALPHSASASNACPSLPCSTEAECREKAGWVIEGTLLDAVNDMPGRSCVREMVICQTKPNEEPVCRRDDSLCGSTPPRPLLILKDVSVVKGEFAFQSESERAVVQRAALCYGRNFQVGRRNLPGYDLTLINKTPPRGERLRFFGHKDSGYLYYFVEFADPTVFGCAANSPPFHCVPYREPSK